MAISNKIKALLNFREKTSAELAEFLGINAQSLRNKYNRNSFSADDLIKAAAFCDAELMFVVDGTQPVKLSMKDLDNKEKDEEEL